MVLLPPSTAPILSGGLAAVTLAWVSLLGLALATGLEVEPDVIILMKDEAFQVLKGGAQGGTPADPSFSLTAGEDVIIMLRNEDRLAHEFVSPLLRRVDLQFSGEATMVYTHTAAGVRVEPGEIVTLRFWLPERFYDLFYFWCDVHGKVHGDKMRGEIFVLEPKKPSGHTGEKP